MYFSGVGFTMRLEAEMVGRCMFHAPIVVCRLFDVALYLVLSLYFRCALLSYLAFLPIQVS